ARVLEASSALLVNSARRRPSGWAVGRGGKDAAVDVHARAGVPRIEEVPLNLTVTLAGSSAGFAGHPEACQRHAGKADAEFLQRRPARDRLGHALSECIEFIVHSFLWFCIIHRLLLSLNQIAP